MLHALTWLGYSTVFLGMTGLSQDYLTWMSQDSWTPQWKASTVFTLSFSHASSVNPYLAVSPDVTFNQLPILNKLWCHLLYPKTLPKVCFCGGVFLLSEGAVGNAWEASLWQICQHRLCLVLRVCLCGWLVAQWCPTLCDPMDGSPPGSSVHRSSQARILEWVTISSSRGILLTQRWNTLLPRLLH